MCRDHQGSAVPEVFAISDYVSEYLLRSIAKSRKAAARSQPFVAKCRVKAQVRESASRPGCRE
jgi:hypothetical protein